MGKISLWYRCLRKAPYSEKEITKAVNKRNKQRGKRERELVAYKCTDCNQWHIGHAVPQPQGSKTEVGSQDG